MDVFSLPAARSSTIEPDTSVHDVNTSALLHDGEGNSDRGGGPYYVRAVGKAALILEALREGPDDLTLAEVCRRVQVQRATAYRLLGTLARHRLVQRTEAGKYRLGLALMALGGAVQKRSVLAEHASPHLRRLAQRLDMTSFLSVLDGDASLCLQRIDAGGMLIVRFRLGEHLPLHTGAGPLLLLAGLPDCEIERILAGPLPALTPRSICDPVQILARIGQLRHDPVAYSDEDVTMGVGAIGAAVKTPTGETIAAVSISALVSDLYGERETEIVRAVREAADAVAAELS
jgi:DNA-binding IclR family transcriptional regulator